MEHFADLPITIPILFAAKILMKAIKHSNEEIKVNVAFLQAI